MEQDSNEVRRVFQMNRGDFEQECLRRGIEPDSIPMVARDSRASL